MIRALTTTVYARPRRLAFLIPEDAQPDLWRWLIDYSCLIWGGILNAMIPTDGEALEDQWWTFLEWHDPDIIVLCGDVSDDLFIALDQRILPLSIVEREGLDHTIPRRLDSLGESLNVTQLALLKHYRDTHMIPPERSLYTTMELSERLHGFDFLHAHMGRHLFDPHKELLRELHAKRVLVESTNPCQLLKCLKHRPHGSWLTPLEQTALGLQGRMPSTLFLGPLARNPGSAAPVTVVLSEQPNANDLCVYWNLRLAHMSRGEHIVWVSLEALASCPRNGADWLRACIESVDRGDGAGLTSSTLSKSQLEELARSLDEAMGKGTTVRVLGSPPGTCVPGPGFLWNARAARDVLADDMSMTVHPVRLKFMPATGGEHLGQWVNEVHLDSAPTPWEGCRLPRVAALACEGLVPSRSDNTRLARATRRTKDGAIALSASSETPAFVLELPGRERLLRGLLGPKSELLRRGRTAVHRTSGRPGPFQRWELTPKGTYVDGVVRLAGTLQEAARMCREWYLRSIIDKASERRSAAGAPTPMGWCHLMRAALPDDNDRHRRQAEEALEWLVLRGILLQGLDLTCAHCGHRGWYLLAQVGADYRCNGCSETVATSSRPEWQYRLNTVVGKAWQNDQQVTILALARLQAEAQHSFIGCPELKLYGNEQGRDGMDIDILAVTDGDILLGECTVSDNFADCDFDKLRDLGRTLDARWLVLASTRSKMSKGFWDRAEKLAEDVWDDGIDVDVLLGEDLTLGRDGKRQRALAHEISHRELRRETRLQG